jgi:two-component system, chemotaxis family, CheB/CheR fusion protein
MRILIVDDDGDSAESQAILLRLDGHEVLTLLAGGAAIAAVANFAPDVVMLDIGLPDIDGYEVARQLRQSGCTARLIAITGYGRAEDKKRAREAGFDQHLLKPVDPLSLSQLFT